jgi:hypothetical protein
MTCDVNRRVLDAHAYQVKMMLWDTNLIPSDRGQSRPFSDSKSYKGKWSNLKCQCCHNLGHLVNRCWLLHL